MIHLFLILLLAGTVNAADFSTVIGYYNAAASSSTYIIDETFAGITGPPSGWTDTGSPDYSTTSGAVIFDINDRTDSDAFSTMSTVYAAFAFEVSSLSNTAATQFVRLLNSSDGTVIHIKIETTGVLGGYHGSVSFQGATVLSVDTPYYVWLTYTKSTPSPYDGILTVKVSDSGIKPAGNEMAITTGTVQAEVVAIQVGQQVSDTGGDITVYRVIVDDEDIGDFTL